MRSDSVPAKLVDFPAPATTRPARIPTAFDDAVIWAAWLYYPDQMNQSEAWGRTVLAAARLMAPREPVPRPTVVQVAGSSIASEDFSPELCTSLMSNRLDARCVNLLAPALRSSAELRGRLMAEPMLVRQFGLIRSCTRLLFGVGDLGLASTVRKSGFANAETVGRYVKGGAAAVIIGWFIGVDGSAVAGDLDERMIGITLDEVRTVPIRIRVAGGPGKCRAIQAALAGGYPTHLVTDIETAQRLLE